VIRFVLFSRVTKGPTAPRKGDNHARVTRRKERGRRERIRRVTANVARLRLGTRRLCGAVCGAPRYEIADVYARARALSLSLSLSLSHVEATVHAVATVSFTFS